MSQTKVIGIISYFPDDERIRKNRNKLLNNLLLTLKRLFKNIPIMIVCQNWNKEETENYSKLNVTLYHYDKLGIVGARKKLREHFLNSPYDYLIMLDDDCTVIGNEKTVDYYLKQIDDNPNCFIEFNKTLLKLFAISKTLFKEVDYDDINPENGEGFEDRIFVNKLRKLYPDKQRTFLRNGLNEYSVSTKDVFSTWYKDQDIKKMLDNTNIFIEQINK